MLHFTDYKKNNPLTNRIEKVYTRKVRASRIMYPKSFTVGFAHTKDMTISESATGREYHFDVLNDVESYSISTYGRSNTTMAYFLDAAGNVLDTKFTITTPEDEIVGAQIIPPEDAVELVVFGSPTRPTTVAANVMVDAPMNPTDEDELKELNPTDIQPEIYYNTIIREGDKPVASNNTAAANGYTCETYEYKLEPGKLYRVFGYRVYRTGLMIIYPDTMTQLLPTDQIHIYKDSSGTKKTNGGRIGLDNEYVIVEKPAIAYVIKGHGIIFFAGHQAIKEVVSVRATTSPLEGVRWLAIGDSFSAGSFTGYTKDAHDEEYGFISYPAVIAHKNHMRLYNLALSGQRSALTSVNTNKPAFADTTKDLNKDIFKSVIKDQIAKNDAPIYVTFAHGLNEAAVTAADIGTSADTGFNTIWGFYNNVIGYVFNNCPEAHVGIIIQDAWMTDTLANALIQIAEYWGVPYLNLHDDNLAVRVGSDTNKANHEMEVKRNSIYAVSATNTHPNPKGIKLYAKYIEEFLKRI